MKKIEKKKNLIKLEQSTQNEIVIMDEYWFFFPYNLVQEAIQELQEKFEELKLELNLPKKNSAISGAEA